MEKLTIYQNTQFNKILEFKTTKNLEKKLKKAKKHIKILGIFFTLLLS